MPLLSRNIHQSFTLKKFRKMNAHKHKDIYLHVVGRGKMSKYGQTLPLVGWEVIATEMLWTTAAAAL
jgi:hypothetical protein